MLLNTNSNLQPRTNHYMSRFSKRFPKIEVFPFIFAEKQWDFGSLMLKSLFGITLALTSFIDFSYLTFLIIRYLFNTERLKESIIYEH